MWLWKYNMFWLCDTIEVPTEVSSMNYRDARTWQYKIFFIFYVHEKH